MTSALSFQVAIHISRDELMKHYQGHAFSVTARSQDGRTVRFPVNILKPFVTADGISGQFVISYDEQGKFKHIERIR